MNFDQNALQTRRLEMVLIRFSQYIEEVEFEDFVFKVALSDNNTLYLQAVFFEDDIVTKNRELQYSRKWLLSEHMTKSEVIQTAFKCCITAMEHRTRENFKYKGKRIFGPHFDVDALADLCGQKAFDVRKEKI
jgi:hypothetical protein